MGAGRRTGLRLGWGPSLVGSGDGCVRERLSCIGLGDRGLGLISGKRQYGEHVAPVEEAGEEASGWESRRKTEGQH